MRHKVTPHSSSDVEPDKQLPRYGLRKKIAQSDGKNLEDARHQSLASRTKRTPTNTRAQSSSWRGSVKKRTRVSSGQGWAKSNKNREWLAEAILEENDTQYLIEYKPVYDGAQSEISWQPKGNANAALVAWWEERKMTSYTTKLTPKHNAANQGYGLAKYGDRLGKSVTKLQSLEQYDAELEDVRQHPIDLVDKRTSEGFEEDPDIGLLETTSTIVPAMSQVTMLKPPKVAVAQMCGGGRPRGPHDSDSLLSNDTERKSEPPPTNFKGILSTESPGSSEISEHNHNCVEIESLKDMAADIEGLESLLIEAANVDGLQGRDAHVSRAAAYSTFVPYVNHRELMGALKRTLGDHPILGDGQGTSYPYPCTGNRKILLPEAHVRHDEGNNAIDPSLQVGGDKATPKNTDYNGASHDSDTDTLGAPLGKLKSARGILRSKLLESREKRRRSNRIPSPPADSRSNYACAATPPGGYTTH
jgi:hypothetical protein